MSALRSFRRGRRRRLRSIATVSVLIVKQTLKKAGNLILTPIAGKASNTKRVVVTNVFTPPVTG